MNNLDRRIFQKMSRENTFHVVDTYYDRTLQSDAVYGKKANEVGGVS